MSGFFDKLKQGLDKGVSTVSVKSKELFDANKISSEISGFERQKKDALLALGTSVAKMIDDGHLDEAALKTARAAIATIEAQIAAKQQELVDVHAEAQRALQGGPTPTQSSS
jgi:hypothetical protein